MHSSSEVQETLAEAAPNAVPEASDPASLWSRGRAIRKRRIIALSGVASLVVVGALFFASSVPWSEGDQRGADSAARSEIDFRYVRALLAPSGGLDCESDAFSQGFNYGLGGFETPREALSAELEKYRDLPVDEAQFSVRERDTDTVVFELIQHVRVGGLAAAELHESGWGISGIGLCTEITDGA